LVLDPRLTPGSLLHAAIQEHDEPHPVICGSKEVVDMLHLYDDVDKEACLTIDWQAIYDLADGFISRQNERVEKLRQELSVEAAKLPGLQLDGMDSKIPLQQAVVKGLLVSALKAGFSCGDNISTVAADGCGMRLYFDHDGYDASRESFEKVIKDGLKEKYQVGRAAVEEQCMELLHTEDPDTFCPQLCKSFGGIAEAYSRVMAAGAVGFQAVLKRIDELHADIHREQTEAHICMSKKEELTRWGKQMFSIKSDIEVQFHQELLIRSKLEVLTNFMEKLTHSINNQTNKTAALKLVVDKESANIANITKAERKLEELQKEVQTAMNDLSEQVLTVRLDVKAYGEASRALSSFKVELEMFLRSIVQIYDTAVPQPMRELGLASALSKLKANLFPQAHCPLANSKTIGADSDGKAIQASCDIAMDRTQKAIKIMKDAAPAPANSLTELCSKEETRWKKYSNDIEHITSTRQDAIVKILEELKEVVESMGCEGEEAQVKEGQPKCLLRILALFGETQIYQQDWRLWSVSATQGNQEVKHPQLIKLSEKVEAAYDSLKKKEKDLVDQIHKVGITHDELLQQASDLRTVLTKALKDERGAQSKYRAAKTLDIELTKHSQQMQTAFSMLKKNFEEATTSVSGSKAKAFAEHKRLAKAIVEGRLKETNPEGDDNIAPTNPDSKASDNDATKIDGPADEGNDNIAPTNPDVKASDNDVTKIDGPGDEGGSDTTPTNQDIKASDNDVTKIDGPGDEGGSDTTPTNQDIKASDNDVTKIDGPGDEGGSDTTPTNQDIKASDNDVTKIDGPGDEGGDATVATNQDVKAGDNDVTKIDGPGDEGDDADATVINGPGDVVEDVTKIDGPGDEVDDGIPKNVEDSDKDVTKIDGPGTEADDDDDDAEVTRIDGPGDVVEDATKIDGPGDEVDNGIPKTADEGAGQDVTKIDGPADEADENEDKGDEESPDEEDEDVDATKIDGPRDEVEDVTEIDGPEDKVDDGIPKNVADPSATRIDGPQDEVEDATEINGPDDKVDDGNPRPADKEQNSQVQLTALPGNAQAAPAILSQVKRHE